MREKPQRRNPFVRQSREIVETYSNEIKEYERIEGLKPALESQETWDSKQKFPVRFVSFAADTLSKLYNEPVKRTLNQEHADNTTLNDLLQEVSDAYQKISPDIDVYTFLGGISAVKPSYYKDKFSFVLFTSDMIDRTPDPVYSYETVEISLHYKTEATEVVEVWSDTDVSVFVDDIEVNIEEENNYGINPITIFRNKNVPNQFFPSPPWGLMKIEEALSMLFVHGGRLAHWQTHGQLVLSGYGSKDKPVIGPGAALGLPSPNADAHFISPNANLNGLIDWVNFVLRTNSNITGIPNSLFNATAELRSGVAIMANNEVLKDYIRKRSKMFAPSEAEALLKGMKVLAYHRGINIPDDLKVLVEHTIPKSPISAQEIAQWEFEFMHDIKTPLDYIMSKNSAMSEDEAREILLKNKKFSQELAAKAAQDIINKKG